MLCSTPALQKTTLRSWKTSSPPFLHRGKTLVEGLSPATILKAVLIFLPAFGHEGLVPQKHISSSEVSCPSPSFSSRCLAPLLDHLRPSLQVQHFLGLWTTRKISTSPHSHLTILCLAPPVLLRPLKPNHYPAMCRGQAGTSSDSGVHRAGLDSLITSSCSRCHGPNWIDDMGRSARNRREKN